MIYLRFVIAAMKMTVAQLYVLLFGNKILSQDIWIFSEKKTEARDNGYHFFRYIRSKHPEINAFYVIQKNSIDRNKVEGLGPVIDFNSLRHCILYYAAKYRVCSQIHGVKPYEEVPGLRRIKIFRRADQKQINLKHGISKDFRPDAFDYRKAKFDLYISAAKPEYDYIKKTFNYPEDKIALTGFCRFDALHDAHEIEKTVLIMPTFREWLRTSDSSKEKASESEAKRFLESDYYNAYKDVLTNKTLHDSLKRNGYKIIFYLHYTFQPYTFLFEELMRKNKDYSDSIVIAGRSNYDVQDLLKRCSILVTDYSSVFFDFAYMHKPVVYYQFDIENYRKKHYQEGYFKYDRDGFGPVCTKPEDVNTYLEKLIDNDAGMEDMYLRRVNDFFIPYDNNNCQRVYDAILRLE